MGYDSIEVLEKAPEEPKKTLDPHEDDKLSGDMRELYDRIQPPEENTQRRNQFVKKLQGILETEFPGNDFKVHVFGSSGNMLYTSESDGRFRADSGALAAANSLDSRYMHPNAHETAGGNAPARRSPRKAYVTDSSLMNSS